MSSINDFDRKQIELLEPLYNDGDPVILHYPFYANTFPLAYHYYLLLVSKGYSQEKIQELILPHSWTNEFPSAPIKRVMYETYKDGTWDEPSKINIFYANEKTANSIQNKIGRYAPERLSTSFYTKFIHRFLFLDYNPWSLAKYKQHHQVDIQLQLLNDALFEDPSSFAEKFISLPEIRDDIEANYKRINVYTDLPHEAEQLFKSVFSTPELVIYEQSKLNFIADIANETLNIYFYGAPTAFYFLSRNKHFIPVFIEELNESNRINIAKGVFCVHYNENKTKSVESLMNALTIYHEQLFLISNLQNGAASLNNIRISYNKLARILNHPSYFRSAQSYANCLAIHHENMNGGTAEIRTQTDQRVFGPDRAVKNKYKIVHIGAGRLGIGFVLPLFRNHSETNLITVVQKNRGEDTSAIDWQALKKKDIVTFNARHGCHNEQEFEWQLDLSVCTSCSCEFDHDQLLFVNNYAEVLPLLIDADVITYATNAVEPQNEIIRLIEDHQHEFKKEVFIFPFENTPVEWPKSSSPFIKIRELKPDRICIDRNTKDSAIIVTNESHFEVVINAVNVEDAKKIRQFFDPNLSNKNLIICETTAKYQLYKKRKQYLVNELHFVLTVYGYHFLLDKKIFNWQNQYITIIQSALQDNPQYAKPIDTYIKLQIFRLLSECDKENLFKEADTKDDYEIVANMLLKYADKVRLRFSDSEADPLHRVFAISTLFDEENLSNFLVPDASKIGSKYKSNYVELARFFKEQYPKNSDIVYSLKPASIEVRTFLEDYKEKLSTVFRQAASQAADATARTRRRLEQREIEVGAFNQNLNEILETDPMLDRG